MFSILSWKLLGFCRTRKHRVLRPPALQDKTVPSIWRLASERPKHQCLGFKLLQDQRALDKQMGDQDQKEPVLRPPISTGLSYQASSVHRTRKTLGGQCKAHALTPVFPGSPEKLEFWFQYLWDHSRYGTLISEVPGVTSGPEVYTAMVPQITWGLWL